MNPLFTKNRNKIGQFNVPLIVDKLEGDGWKFSAPKSSLSTMSYVFTKGKQQVRIEETSLRDNKGVLTVMGDEGAVLRRGFLNDHHSILGITEPIAPPMVKTFKPKVSVQAGDRVKIIDEDGLFSVCKFLKAGDMVKDYTNPDYDPKKDDLGCVPNPQHTVLVRRKFTDGRLGGYRIFSREEIVYSVPRTVENKDDGTAVALPYYTPETRDWVWASTEAERLDEGQCFELNHE